MGLVSPCKKINLSVQHCCSIVHCHFVINIGSNYLRRNIGFFQGHTLSSIVSPVDRILDTGNGLRSVFCLEEVSNCP